LTWAPILIDHALALSALAHHHRRCPVAALKRRQCAIRDDILTARDDSPTGAPKTESGRRVRYLFSGLLECGCCSAGYIMISDSRYGCSANRNRGTHDNRRSIKRNEIEERVLGGLKHQLMTPDLVAEFIAEFQREVQKERLEAMVACST
jgi:hypothetical protein